MIGIPHIYFHTPGQQVMANSLPEYAGLEGAEKEYFHTCGIQSIRDAGSLGAYELALGAAKGVLAESGLEAGDLDFMLYIRPRIPEKMISSDSTRLQHALGAEKAVAFAIGDLGCADSSMAVKLAIDLLKANRRAQHILIAYGHKQYSPVRFRYPVTIQGDGGVAVLVQRSDTHQVRAVELDMNGKYWDLFQMPYRDRLYADYREECSDPRRYGFELAIESKNRFTDLNQKALEQAGWEKGEINHYLMQNISARAFTYYEQAFEMQLARPCRENLGRFGHLGCADILVNLKTGLEQGLFGAGQKVMLMNNSPVAAWSTLLLEI